MRKIQNAIRLRKANVNAKINREFNIEYKDAFHVACAIYAECEYFLTTDIRLQRCYRGGEIIIVNPLEFIQLTGGPNQNVQHI